MLTEQRPEQYYIDNVLCASVGEDRVAGKAKWHSDDLCENRKSKATWRKASKTRVFLAIPFSDWVLEYMNGMANEIKCALHLAVSFN